MEHSVSHSMRGSFKSQIDYRDGRRCALCGNGEPHTHIGRHHITPRKEGGIDSVFNVVTLCKHHHELADNDRIPRDELRAVVIDRNKQLLWAEVRIDVRRRRKEKQRGKTDPKRYRNHRRRAGDWH